MKKKLMKWLKVLLIIYIVIGVAAYFFQEKFLFHPLPLKHDYKYSLSQPFVELNIPYDSSTNFNVIQFKLLKDTASSSKEMGYQKDTTCKGVVLYFHGNKDNINHYEKHASNFTKNGYEVWMIDYPTFGKSTGTLTETMLYEEAKQLYLLARSKFVDSNIIIYGKSLGTGIAAQLASTEKCRKLILETPYYNIVSIANHYAWMYPVEYFSKYKIPTNEYFKKITVPISILHGTDDGVIPYSNALKLKMLMKPSDEFISIEKGKHNNLGDFPLFHQKLDSLLK